MDTISQDGFSKTKINKPVARKEEELTEEEKEKKLKNFVKANEKDLKVIKLLWFGARLSCKIEP